MHSWIDLAMSPKGENNKRINSWGTLLSLHHFGDRRDVEVPKWGLGRVTSKSITHTDLHKLNNKLVSA
jgi:hypothetical protein